MREWCRYIYRVGVLGVGLVALVAVMCRKCLYICGIYKKLPHGVHIHKTQIDDKLFMWGMRKYIDY